MREETAVIAKNMFGPKDYQHQAKKALPVLVRQALSGKPIFYQNLATELGMPNPRNLNYVLGSVGQTLIELSDKLGENIPPIQCLVINQAQKIPGQGFGWFMPDAESWKVLSKREKEILVQSVMQQIYAYPRWRLVLKELQLPQLKPNYSKLIFDASHMGGVGESPDHKALKEYVRTHPEVLGLGKRFGAGISEHALPSGDRVDVFFGANDLWIGAEVKSKRSDEADIFRGLFQCVKYKAVLNAMLVAEQLDIAARAVLVLEGTLPTGLRELRNMLDIEVIENVNSGSDAAI